MYTFEKITDTTGGLYIIKNNEISVAYLRIKYGIVNLYPLIDDEVCWGIILKSWVFDDVDKASLTKEEDKKICSECETPIEEFLEELEEDSYYIDDVKDEFLSKVDEEFADDSYYMFEKENPGDEDI